MTSTSTIRNAYGVDVRERLRRDRYAMIPATEFDRTRITTTDLQTLQNSWNVLGEDPFFGGGDAATRTRRYSDFGYDPATHTLTPLAHVPYFQSREMNAFVGGTERHFADVALSTVANSAFAELVRLDFENLPLEPEYSSRLWVCQVHQIRITVNPGRTYDVVPEGIHSDGYPFAGLHLIRKDGLTGGESVVFDWAETELARGTLDAPLDSLLFEDKKLKHYASPITAGPDGGVRDVLAISFSLPGTEHETVR